MAESFIDALKKLFSMDGGEKTPQLNVEEEIKKLEEKTKQMEDSNKNKSKYIEYFKIKKGE